jgi:uncharacterized protein YkwD
MVAKHKNKHTHGKHSKHYVKAYWPYLPLLTFVGFGLFVSFHFRPAHHQGGVLSYATNVSQSGLLQETNQQRTANSMGTLSTNTLLIQAAQAKANDMVARNYWSHNTPDGQEPWVFIDNAGYQYTAAGENLAYGFDSSADTITGWMNSPPHRENLLNTSYKDVGFGIANSANYQNTGPETIVVAMYGKPALVAAAASPTPAPAPAVTVPSPAPAPIAGPTPAESSPAASAPVAAASLPAPLATTKPKVSGQPQKEPEPKAITIAATLAGNYAAVSSIATGLVIAVSVTYLFIAHGLAMRRTIKRGERFFIQHPVLDVTIIAVIALCILLNQANGFIR